MNAHASLAVSSPPPSLASGTAQYLTFSVDGKEYSVDIMTVREVKGWAEVTRLPNSPPYMRGVLNLRGVILPIFDLRARFGGERIDATPNHVIIILVIADRLAGLLVDAVSDILTVAPSDIKPPPQTDGITASFIPGIISMENRMVVLLDIESLLKNDHTHTTT